MSIFSINSSFIDGLEVDPFGNGVILPISKCFAEAKFQTFEPNFNFRAVNERTVELLQHYCCDHINHLAVKCGVSSYITQQCECFHVDTVEPLLSDHLGHRRA